MKPLPEKCKKILDVLMGTHRKLQIVEIGRPFGIQDNYANKLITDKLMKKYGYPIISEKVPGESYNVYWYDHFARKTGEKKEKNVSRSQLPVHRLKYKNEKIVQKRYGELTAEYIYHEKRVECLDCGAYWQAASVGKRCNACFVAGEPVYYERYV